MGCGRDYKLHMSNIYPVILSGGSGTRLWPISRSLYPKQFLKIGSSKSFFQETALRFFNQSGYESPIIICNSEHRFIVKEQLAELDITPTAVILEEEGRNTAAAAAIASLKVSDLDPHGLVLLLASDHLVKKPSTLRQAIQDGKEAACADKIVIFGIKPTKPETGYGYIKMGSSMTGFETIFNVDEFVEKPDQKTARSYFKSGDYLWNSSLFLFKPNCYLSELEELNPEIAKGSRRAYKEAKMDLGFLRLNKKVFNSIPSISIDYAVMEKTPNAAIVPVAPGWNDIGSWDALWETLEKDELNTATIGDVISLKTKNTLVHSTSRLVTAIGLDNIIVAETSDAVLVANKDHTQSVKLVVAELETLNRSEHIAHNIIHRPWGTFEILNTGSKYQTKRISVNPGASLSLQSHKKRAEHWVVVEGIANITLGEDLQHLEDLELHPNQSTYIPIGFLHRLENKQQTPLVIIEVQTGGYLGEDDIERYEDLYGRNVNKIHPTKK